MIELRVLGSIRLHDTATGNSIESALAQPKRVALLAYMALAGRGRLVRRDDLLAMFWAESDDQRGRAALSQALYVLRRALGEPVIVTRGDEEVGLAEEHFWCDVAAFEAALRSGDARSALDLYAGDLLPAFHVADALEFERWLEDERTRLRAAAAEAAWRVVEELERADNYAQAAHYARRALALQPYDERALQRVLTTLERAGDRAGAIQEFETFARRMRADLELEVSAETQAMADALRAAPTAEVLPRRAAVASESTRRPQRLKWIAAAVMALVLLVAAAVTLRPDEHALRADRVIVAEFTNETGDATLAPVGRIAADWIAQGLVQTGLVEVVPAITAFRSEQGLRGDQQARVPPRVLAQDAGAGLVIAGSYYKTGDSLVVQAQILETATGKLVRGLDRAAVAGSNPMPAIEAMRQRALGALGQLRDARLNAWANKASQPPSFEAYQAYADALDHFFQATPEAQREAVKHFRKAAAYDSTFTAPLLWALFAYKNTQQLAAADSLARELERRRDRLAPWDRAVLAMHQADLRGDLDGAYEQSKRVAALTPDTEWQFVVAMHAMWLNRQREVLRILLGMNPEQGWIRSWPSYWSARAGVRHLLGQDRAALKETRHALTLHPEDRLLQMLEIRALVGLGRLDEAERRTQALVAAAPPPAKIDVHMVLSNELALHGHRAAARHAAERALQTPIPSRMPRMSGPNARAQLLIAAGKPAEALRITTKNLQQDSSLAARGLHGIAAAGAGDTTVAVAMMRGLEQIRPRYSHGLPAYWRAAIAAHLGRRADAVALLREALAQGYQVDMRMHATPLFAPLWSYAPYRELVASK